MPGLADCCRGTYLCCRGCARFIGRSRGSMAAYLSFISVASLSLFIYSCVLLSSVAQSGPSCDGDTTCRAGISVQGCTVLPVTGAGCDDACFAPAVAGYIPLQFYLQGAADAGMVRCPFPKTNT